MEYVEGDTLSNIIKKQRLTVPQIKHIIVNAANGLQHAHVRAERGEPSLQPAREVRDVVLAVVMEEAECPGTERQAGAQPRRSIQDLLGELVDQFRVENNEIAWSLTSYVPAPLILPDSQREQLEPVVREALSNACRHARAGQIHVILQSYDNQIQILVEDDGQGFRANRSREDQKGHFGLRIMRARAARMGGYLQVDSVPGKGTRISLCWPLERDVHHVASPALEPALPSTPPVLSGVRG
jgi:signal transduction histidine kinase